MNCESETLQEEMAFEDSDAVVSRGGKGGRGDDDMLFQHL